MVRRNVYCLMLAGLVAASVPSCVGGSAVDNEGSVEQDILPPTLPPTNLTATTTGPNNIALTWDAVAGSTKYYIFRGTSPGSEAYLTSTVPNSFNDGHLTSGQQYCYYVEAVVGGIASPPSNESCATTTGAPNPPTNVVATPVSTTRVNVTWDAVAGAIKYYVYMSTSGGAYAFQSTTTTNSYVAANLMANTSYCFEIAVVTANGTSANSSPGCTTTFTGALEGYWKLNEKTGSTAMDSSGQNRNGAISNATYSTTDRPPVADDFSTLAFTGATSSAVSVPNAPALNAQGPFTVSLWIKVTNAGTGTLRFIGKRAAGCGATTWQLAQDSNGLRFDSATTRVAFGQSLPVGTWTHVAVSLTGGNGNQARFYINGQPVVTAGFSPSTATTSPLELGNSGDCGSSGGTFLIDEVQIYSTALTDAQIADLGTPPPAPTGLAGTSPGQTSVNLSWNSVTNAQKYFVWRGTTSGTEAMMATVFAPTTTYSDTHLTSNTTYYYQVSVQAHGLLSTTSTEVPVTTQPPPPPPSNVTATPGTTGRIIVAWTAVAGATKYYVYQSAGGGAYAFRATVTAAGYTATSLTTGVNYCYEIVAETSPGIDSAVSSPACATAP